MAASHSRQPAGPRAGSRDGVPFAEDGARAWPAPHGARASVAESRARGATWPDVRHATCGGATREVATCEVRRVRCHVRSAGPRFVSAASARQAVQDTARAIDWGQAARHRNPRPSLTLTMAWGWGPNRQLPPRAVLWTPRRGRRICRRRGSSVACAAWRARKCRRIARQRCDVRRATCGSATCPEGQSATCGGAKGRPAIRVRRQRAPGGAGHSASHRLGTSGQAPKSEAEPHAHHGVGMGVQSSVAAPRRSLDTKARPTDLPKTGLERGLRRMARAQVSPNRAPEVRRATCEVRRARKGKVRRATCGGAKGRPASRVRRRARARRCRPQREPSTRDKRPGIEIRGRAPRSPWRGDGGPIVSGRPAPFAGHSGEADGFAEDGARAWPAPRGARRKRRRIARQRCDVRSARKGKVRRAEVRRAGPRFVSAASRAPGGAGHSASHRLGTSGQGPKSEAEPHAHHGVGMGVQSSVAAPRRSLDTKARPPDLPKTGLERGLRRMARPQVSPNRAPEVRRGQRCDVRRARKGKVRRAEVRRAGPRFVSAASRAPGGGGHSASHRLRDKRPGIEIRGRASRAPWRGDGGPIVSGRPAPFFGHQGEADGFAEDGARAWPAPHGAPASVAESRARGATWPDVRRATCDVPGRAKCDVRRAEVRRAGPRFVSAASAGQAVQGTARAIDWATRRVAWSSKPPIMAAWLLRLPRVPPPEWRSSFARTGAGSPAMTPSTSTSCEMSSRTDSMICSSSSASCARHMLDGLRRASLGLVK